MSKHISTLSVFSALLILLLFSVSCKKNDGQLSKKEKNRLELDSTQLQSFFTKFPKFAKYKAEYSELYKEHNWKMVWYDADGRVDFAEVLLDEANNLSKEGLPQDFPYRDNISDVVKKSDRKKPVLEDDLLLTGLYFYYSSAVFDGKVTEKKMRNLGWLLPRKKLDYTAFLETLSKDPEKLDESLNENFGQYYLLRDALANYRKIKDEGGFVKIPLAADFKNILPGEQSATVLEIRKRLAQENRTKKGDSDKYDNDLLQDIQKLQQLIGQKSDGEITKEFITYLNVPVEERIKNIVVNMERCRWVNPGINQAQEYVFVNIPSYYMRYVRDGKMQLASNVVVGKELNQTVIFSGNMSYLVFSPYWNVPESILEKEIKPAIAKEPNYLKKHHMEWVDKRVRQLPGEHNSLGLVKFMFPNQNSIYLHDSPAKHLYNENDRALSHGCVRVEKAKELANKILEDDKNWNADKIDKAMHSSKEINYTLDRKIPVIIAYFTAWADENGSVVFYQDIYNRDESLYRLMYK